MNRFIAFAWMWIVVLILAGCAGGKGNSPIVPQLKNQAVQTESHGLGSHEVLWGYYDIYIDPATQTAKVVPNRDVDFTVNVVKFLNGATAALAIKVNGLNITSDNVDVDLDLTITHPFPGKPQFNGYDVRGIFLGDGSKTMSYNPKLKYAGHGGMDQEMYDFGQVANDPHPQGIGMPDGYTRWWNPTEFTSQTIFGYVPGSLGTKGYIPTATLNPYKYFAEGLGVSGDLWTFLTTVSGNGVFPSGTQCTRNYYIRFPKALGLKFEYAIAADWKGIDPSDQPANAVEATGLSVTVAPDIYYVDSTNKGGDLILDGSFQRAWGKAPSTVWIESTVLNAPQQLTGNQMIPVGGGSTWSTYHIDIPADNITGNSSTQIDEFWVIPEYDAYDYTNPLNIPNSCGANKLAAFFRYGLYVSPVQYPNTNKPPIVSSGVSGNASPWLGTTEQYSVVATDPDGDPITYAWTVTDKDTGVPDPGYNGIAGDGVGNLSVDWSTVTGAAPDKQFIITCTVTDNKSAPVPATPLDITLVCPVPVPTAIDPMSSLPDQIVTNATITIDNNALMDGPGLAAQLAGDSATIDGTNVTFVDSSHLTATFDLTGAGIGDYNVKVTNGCGAIGLSSTTLFTITNCPAATPTAIDPTSSGVDSVINSTITVDGNLQLGPSLAAQLVGDTMTVDATGLKIIDPGHLAATFDLTGAPVGDYKVRVINGCGASADSATTLFSIIQCNAATPTAIDPDTGTSGSFINGATITVDGNLVNGSQLGAALVQGTEVINAFTVQYVDSTHLTASFGLFGAGVGDYYVQVTNGCGTVATSANTLFNIPCGTATATGIFPNNGNQDSQVNSAFISCNGGLVNGPSLAVALVGDSATINGTNVNFLSGNSLTASFDLTGAPMGGYKVKIVNGCGTEATSANDLFTVNCPGPAPTAIDPTAALTGSEIDAKITTGAGLVDGASLAASLVQGGGPNPTQIAGTNVTYVDGTTLTAHFSLAGANTGAYRVRVTNGCGGIGTSNQSLFTVQSSKNIHILNNATAIDLTLDPTTSDVLVLADKGLVYRYTNMSGYSTGTTTNLGESGVYKNIDCAGNGYWFVAGATASDPHVYTQHFDPDDSLLNSWTINSGGGSLDGITCMPNLGSTAYDHIVLSIQALSDTQNQAEVGDILDPDFTNGNFLYGTSSNDPTGYFHPTWIKGMDANSSTGDIIWTVEGANNWYASAWTLDNVNMTMTYAGLNFGTGAQTDSDNGLNNPQDITSGKSHQMYILDRLSTSASRIKAFNPSNGSAITPGVNIQTTGTPIRIDGSSDLSLLAVLSVNGMNAYLSIYGAAELP